MIEEESEAFRKEMDETLDISDDIVIAFCKDGRVFKIMATDYDRHKIMGILQDAHRMVVDQLVQPEED